MLDFLETREITSYDWIAPSYHGLDKIKNAYNIIKFVNNIDDDVKKSAFIINNRKIYIPDSALFNIKNHHEFSPCNVLWEKFESYNLGKMEDTDITAVIIILIILTTEDHLGFSFIDPFYIPAVYIFIDKYLPEYEKYLSIVVNRIISAILCDKDEHVLKSDAVKALLLMYRVIPESKYPSITKAVGYAIWSRPVIAATIIGDFEIGEGVVCYRNVMWSDVYATLLVIKYASEDELKKLDGQRSLRLNQYIL
jgi:hypothetical protein